jgi:hypothetical protein
VNTQLGIYYLRHYNYSNSEQYLRKAVTKVTENYTTPKYCEPLYYLGLCLFEQDRFEEAYDWLSKSSWCHEWESASYYLIASIDCMHNDYEKALSHFWNIKFILAKESCGLPGIDPMSIDRNKHHCS